MVRVEPRHKTVSGPANEHRYGIHSSSQPRRTVMRAVMIKRDQPFQDSNIDSDTVQFMENRRANTVQLTENRRADTGQLTEKKRVDSATYGEQTG